MKDMSVVKFYNIFRGFHEFLWEFYNGMCYHDVGTRCRMILRDLAMYRTEEAFFLRRKLLLGLLVVCLAFGSGAAFAVETITYLPPMSGAYPDPEGAHGISVFFPPAHFNLLPHQHQALVDAFRRHGTPLGGAEVALVAFNFPPYSQIVRLNWREYHLLFNYRTNRFDRVDDVSSAMFNAAGRYLFMMSSDYNEFNFRPPFYPRDAAFLSVRGATRGGSGGGGGGCSVLTMGAVALFLLLPMFALRRKR